MAKLLITYKKSAIGYSQRQKLTIQSLGLRKLNSQVIKEDTPSTRGMVFAVRHLVTLEEVADDAELPRPRPTVRPRVLSTPATAPAPRQTLVAPVAEVTAPAAPVAEVVAPVVPVAVEPAATLAAPVAPVATKPAAADDLEVLEGIGPKIGATLRAAGITTFAQLAAMTPEQIREVVIAGGVKLFDATTWPEQAALAASGDWDALNQLTAQLKSGRRE